MYRLLRPLLFRLDPETAHDLVIAAMRAAQPFVRPQTVDFDPKQIWGLSFRNPVGIAAGFDKNARVVPFLQALGFGFIEVGTVTLRAQSGNPRPRVFRYPDQRALINRLGFNNDGAHAVARRLAHLRTREVPLFVNIGMNRDVAPEAIDEHYRSCYRILAPVADAVVINVSSPNTPGLRDLQHPDQLERILAGMRGVREDLAVQQPILVKIAPDLSSEQVRQIAAVCTRLADGIVATNTTVERPPELSAGEAGGLSGAPLFSQSTAILRELRQVVGPSFPLVGVGGIMSAADARLKLEAGADLVQVYTGFVYNGPGFPKEIMNGLSK